jgi:hypothetical protein
VYFFGNQLSQEEIKSLIYALKFLKFGNATLAPGERLTALDSDMI